MALFSAWSITAVGKSAQEVVVEVRACPQRMMSNDMQGRVATQGMFPDSSGQVCSQEVMDQMSPCSGRGA